MLSNRVLGRLIPSNPLRHSAVACMLALGVSMAACGSDKAVDTDKDPSTTPVADVTVVNSDKLGTEPTFATLSDVSLTSASGTTTKMPYATMTSNPNAAADRLNRSYGITVYDYDICTFGFNHGYSSFPTGKFNFGGFYLVNGTPGAPLVTGSYAVGPTSGMYVDIGANVSGSGYNFDKCKGSYAVPQSGSIEITAVNATTASGTMDVTMNDGSKFTGSFTAGATAALRCKPGSNNTPPVPANPDPYACTKLQ